MEHEEIVNIFKDKNLYVRFPWYVKAMGFVLKPRFEPDCVTGFKTIRKYQNIGKKKYSFDYTYNIKQKKFKTSIRIIF